MNTVSMADFQSRAKFLSSQSIILVKASRPMNKFQENAVNLVASALHGVVFDSSELMTIKNDIVLVLKKLDSLCPRKHKRLDFVFNDRSSDPFGNCEAANLTVFDTKSNEAADFMKVWFMPLRGIGDLNKVSGNFWLYYISPFKYKKPLYGWADQYNNLLFNGYFTNTKGGAK